MAILVLVLLFAIAVVAVAHPLVTRQVSTGASAAATDRDVETAVRTLRAARSDSRCPACGHTYRPVDSFCVKCGADLTVEQPAGSAAAAACPQCGVPLRPGDVFCSKCGHRVAAGEEL